MLSSMSVLVLEDLCFSLSSLPPKEAMVAVVSKDMVDGAVWYRRRVMEDWGRNGNRGGLRSFESSRIE